MFYQKYYEKKKRRTVHAHTNKKGHAKTKSTIEVLHTKPVEHWRICNSIITREGIELPIPTNY